jgi:hypothetical protein
MQGNARRIFFLSRQMFRMLAELGRGLPLKASEHALEMGQIIEADLKGDVRDGHIGTS